MNETIKIRLDDCVAKRFSMSKSKAASLIMQGKVLVNDRVQSKSGLKIKPDAKLVLLDQSPFVSRGGQKLKGALEDFSLSVVGLTCLDVGASTGGFTDCLLQMNAQRICAIDVGTNQMDVKIKNDPRVVYKENFHVKDLRPDTFNLLFDLIVADLSFISLKKVIYFLIPVLKPKGFMLLLFKPQFECENPKDLIKGVLKNETKRLALLEDFKIHLSCLGLTLMAIKDSQLKGTKGNQETFVLIQRFNPNQ